MKLNLSIFIYNLAIQMYHFSIWIASFFNGKAKKWVMGRQNWQENLKEKITSSDRPIWIHCASLGEFEQGRSLIEKIKKEQPNSKILLTFYSPSGYEIRQNYPLADFVIYLPADGKKTAKAFLQIVRPRMAIFVKYEFWFHYLKELNQRKIPTYLIAAIFRKEQPFFRWYGQLHRQMLACFSRIFFQNEDSFEKLATLQNKHQLPLQIAATDVVGDPRIDRVLTIQQEKKDLPIITHFCQNAQKNLVCGSTWPADEKLLIPFINHSLSAQFKFIIAPHEIDPAHIQAIEKQLKVGHQTYSDAQKNGLREVAVLIIDNIGLLAHLYRFGTLAYIGGGFGSGIHNTLEPIAFGLPVVFGTNYQKFQEAVTLVENGGAFCIQNEQELTQIFEKLAQEHFYQNASKQALLFLEKNKGATDKIYRTIF